MITKHIVSNDISMRGEIDAVPLPLYQREKVNTVHGNMQASYGDITNLRVVFDAPSPALSVHTKTNGKKY